jgi:ketosteroid isomerase-like protein
MEKFLEIYNKLNSENLDLLAEIYAENVVFIDPAHEILGLKNLQRYFASMYSGLHSASFTFSDTQRKGDHAYVQWTMDFSHPKLGGGKIISLPGVSSLKFDSDDKAIYHRDFFDMGAMLYEHLPLFGKMIKLLKKRLGT